MLAIYLKNWIFLNNYYICCGMQQILELGRHVINL